MSREPGAITGNVITFQVPSDVTTWQRRTMRRISNERGARPLTRHNLHSIRSHEMSRYGCGMLTDERQIPQQIRRWRVTGTTHIISEYPSQVAS